MKKFLGIILILIFSFGMSGSVFGEKNIIKTVSFNNTDISSVFLGEGSKLISLFIEDDNGLFLKKYSIEILKGKDLLEVIKTDGFRDTLKLKRITDEKYIGFNNISLKIRTDYDKKGYIYDEGIISVVKPIVLVSGELGPDGGSITNVWKDIHINVDKGKLTKKYKIDYIGGLDQRTNISFRFIVKPYMSQEEMSELNLLAPSYSTIKHNYLIESNNNDFYIYKDIEKIDFRKIIDVQKKLDKAWDYYRIAYRDYIGMIYGDSIEKIDFDIVDLNLKKAKNLIIEIHNELNNEVKYTRLLTSTIDNISNRITILEKDIIQDNEALNIHKKKEKNKQKINIKSKPILFKNLILSKKELEKTKKGELFKKAIDKQIYNFTDAKLIEIYKKLEKIDLNNSKFKKHKNILQYLEAKIGLEIYKRNLVEK